MEPFEPFHYPPEVEKRAQELEARFPKINSITIREMLHYAHAAGKPLSHAEPLLRLVTRHGAKVYNLRHVMPEVRGDPKRWGRVLRESARLGKDFLAGFPAAWAGDFQVHGEKSPHVEAMSALSIYTRMKGQRLATMGFHLYHEGGKRVMLVTNVQGTPDSSGRVKLELGRLRRETGLPWTRLLGLLTLAHAERLGVQEVRGLRGDENPFASELQPNLHVFYDATWRWLKFKPMRPRYFIKTPPFLTDAQRERLRRAGVHA
jgi:hypothetical protein